jgi:hypothetical protein
VSIPAIYTKLWKMAFKAILHACQQALRWVMPLLVAGCVASSGSAKSSFLLEQDYQKMSNPQLIEYEQELSAEIGRSSDGGPGNMSIGFGFGSWGSSSGFGLGVDQTVGSGPASKNVELRDRREAVRVEMRRRNLLPPAAGGN